MATEYTSSRKRSDLILEVGYVYVMTNEHIPDLIKIGMTRRTPEERSIELSSTGVPGRWAVVYSIFVPNCEKIEKNVHETLNVYRLSDDREFFRVEISAAIEAIELHAQGLIACFPGWPNLEMVTLYVDGELARIKDETAKRVEQYRLEKQVRSIELEIESKQRERQAKQAIVDRNTAELERIDYVTRRDLKQGYIGGQTLFPLALILIGLFWEKQGAFLFFWLGLLLFLINLHMISVEKKEAIKLRNKHNLPDWR